MTVGDDAPGTARLDASVASAQLGLDLSRLLGPDPARGVDRVAVVTAIASLADPPVDAHDAYLRLHLLSHRLVRPRQANLDGLFGVLNNVVWTSAGPCSPDGFERTRLALRAGGRARAGVRGRQVPPHDRLRAADRGAHRRRRPRPAGRPPGRGHDRHARGLRELQRRHRRHRHGGGPHQRGRDRGRRFRRRRWGLDHGHAVGRRQGGDPRRQALPDRRQRRHRHLARRRLRRSRPACTSPPAPGSPCPTAP